MRVLIRADASRAIGTGHVMRCLTLARKLKGFGVEAGFLCRPHPGHIGGIIREMGFSVVEMSPGSGGEHGTLPHSGWLGCNQETDAAEVAEILQAEARSGHPVDGLVVDHYALDARWETALRPRVRWIAAIDDLADRDHDCDLLLDQNLHPNPDNRYRNRLPAGCTLLLGPRFALLRDEFRAARARLRPRDGRVSRALIFFGGSDPDNVTGMALEAWRICRKPGMSADLVLGASNVHRGLLEEACGRDPEVTLHANGAPMADMMVRADLALGAGGTTTWERCCLGLPTLCLSIAENQVAIARTADERGLLRYLGDFRAVDAGRIAHVLEPSFTAPAELARMSSACLDVVDGLGAERVAATLRERGLR